MSLDTNLDIIVLETEKDKRGALAEEITASINKELAWEMVFDLAIKYIMYVDALKAAREVNND